MNILRRLLSVLILVLTFTCGAALSVHVWYLDFPVAVAQKKMPSSGSILTPPMRSRSIIPLTRLFVLPDWSPKKTLVSVMIENHEDARPYHRGLEDALMIQEFFVEGFITRFIALFDAKKPPKILGPVRSLRPYFIDGVSPYSSVVLHAGGSPEALERIEEDSSITSFNGLWLEEHFVRTDSVPAPHDIFLSRSGITDLLQGDVEMQKIQWPPYKTGSAPVGEEALSIHINYSSPFHNIQYTYDPYLRSYRRLNGALLSAATPRNVLVLSMPITGIGEYGRLSIDSVGVGEAILFRSGKVYQGAWSREEVADPFVFTNESGDEFVFVSGQTWMTVVEDMARVRWESGDES